MTACPFCAIVAGTAPAEILHRWPEAIAITPLNPVVPGHVLVIPRRHVADFTEPFPGAWLLVGRVMAYAAEYAAHEMGDCNLITSKGEAASQSVFHLHVHLLPRRPGDDVTLPWPHNAATPAPIGLSAAGSAPPG